MLHPRRRVVVVVVGNSLIISPDSSYPHRMTPTLPTDDDYDHDLRYLLKVETDCARRWALLQLCRVEAGRCHQILFGAGDKHPVRSHLELWMLIG